MLTTANAKVLEDCLVWPVWLSHVTDNSCKGSRPSFPKGLGDRKAHLSSSLHFRGMASRLLKKGIARLEKTYISKKQ